MFEVYELCLTQAIRAATNTPYGEYEYKYKYEVTNMNNIHEWFNTNTVAWIMILCNKTAQVSPSTT